MALLGTYDFESQTPNATVTATSPWATDFAGADTITARAAAAMHGSLGGRIAGGANYQHIRYDIASGAGLYVLDHYVKPIALAANTYILTATAGVTGLCNVRLNPGRTVTIRSGTSAVATSTEALTLGQWYRFSWGVHATDLTQELRVYEGESTTALFTLTGARAAGTLTRLITGLTTGEAGYQGDLDTIRVADDWLTPVNPSTPLAAPTLTISAQTDASGPAASDGSVTVAWPPVSGAAGYQRCILPGHVTTGFTEQGAATSPRAFTGLAAGAYTVAIRAKA